MDLTEKTIQCPYCGERFPITIDPSEGEDQSFVHDCDVCCRPIDVIVSMQEGKLQIRTKQGSQI